MRTASLTLVFLMASSLAAQPAAQDRAKQLEFFETKVRPLLADHCISCHGAVKPKGGVRLDRKEFVFKVSDEPLLVPGHPEKSLLVHVIKHEGDVKMPPPPKAKLSAQAIADLTTWIKLGAAWPDEKAANAVDPRKHWAFQPVKMPAFPTVKQTDWPASPTDAFVLAKLEAKGLAPNPLADPRTLIRRLYFDLIGLPPTYAEVEHFAAACRGEAQNGKRHWRNWLIACSPRRNMANAGLAIGSTWPVTPTPKGTSFRKNGVTPTPTLIVTTW